MKKIFLFVASMCFMMNITAQFSVAPNLQVEFAPGNLQYNAVLDSFRFAPNQWTVIGYENQHQVELKKNTHWIDLFGWATSGYDNTANDPYAFHFQPWEYFCELEKCVSWEQNQFAFGPSMNCADINLVGTSANYDWGVYNANQLGEGWRTMTEEEWKYLLYKRPNAAKLNYLTELEGVRGLMLLPDDGNHTHAVFLPYGGVRYGSAIADVEIFGSYWTSTCHNSGSAYFLGVNLEYVSLSTELYGRHTGRSVRLVRNIK